MTSGPDAAAAALAERASFTPGVALARQRDALASVAAVLRQEAARVDEQECFPQVGLAQIRASGLMGLLVPVELGGLGGTLSDLALGARVLGGGCLSTSLIWSMHCQQVAVIDRYGSPRLREQVLPAIAAGELYVASVTSERGKGGHLTSAAAALEWGPEGVAFDRDAPVVTGGGEADAYLMTMRRDAGAHDSEVVLVYAAREAIDATAGGAWRTMGVRGTQSGGMRLAGTVAAHQVIDPPDGFAAVAGTTMIPAGHVAWAGSWLGAAHGALREVVAALRDPEARKRMRAVDELGAERLARVRIAIDTVESFLRCYAHDYDRTLAEQGPGGPILRSPAFNIRTNNLKVVASELAFAAVDQLLQFTGLGGGYRRDGALPVERAFRDLRSAAIMYANERLLVASGKLALFDGAAEPFVARLDAPEGDAA
jgi:alkylation response protein AidB-like acyl-CoA dehydrogenase